jgi:hypothetical protein
MNRIQRRTARFASAAVAAAAFVGGAAFSPTARAEPAAAQPPAATAAVAGAVTGSRPALVITVALNGAATLPTPAAVAANVITASRPWFAQASHGVFGGYFALARGPVTVQTTADVCSGAWLTEIGDQANAAIIKREPKLDLNGNGKLDEFGAVVYYFDQVDACFNPNPDEPDGASGWGDLPAQSNRVWLNGDSSLRVAVHELGHNLGLSHSGSESCTDPFGRSVPFDFTCKRVEYGDKYSSMGGELSDGYSPEQLVQLGWTSGQVATLTENAATTQYVLTPQEASAPGTRALRLVDGANTLWVEYRVPALIDGPTPQGFNGGLIVRAEPTVGPAPAGAPFLLYMNGSGTTDAGLSVGQQWANPLGKAHITLVASDATHATVTIRWATTLITVPTVLYATTDVASHTITGAGLVQGPITTSIDSVCDDAGKVIRQTPSAGKVVPARSRVDLVVAVANPASHCPVAE